MIFICFHALSRKYWQQGSIPSPPSSLHMSCYQTENKEVYCILIMKKYGRNITKIQGTLDAINDSD